MKYTPKFYFGLILITTSLMIGKLTTITFFIYINDPTIRYTSLIIYILSWPMLILGAYFSGQEYLKKMTKYSTPQYYKDTIKEHATTAYHKTEPIRTKVKQASTRLKRLKRKPGSYLKSKSDL